MSAQQYGMDPNTFAQALDQQGQVPQVLSEVARRKALASVLEKVQVVDTDGNTVDLNQEMELEGDEASDDDEAPAADATDEAATDEAATEEASTEEA